MAQGCERLGAGSRPTCDLGGLQIKGFFPASEVAVSMACGSLPVIEMCEVVQI